jgi:4-amino-4-deoxy-L-arabinose transferase-like glycosyltransferase
MQAPLEVQGRGAAAVAVVIVLAALAPFLGKAFHLDDPVFLWTAEQVLVAPGDFFGSRVNWLGFETPMAQATMNPPLVSYYIALVIALGGSGEIALHAAFALFPAAVVLGTFRLARRIGAAPLLSSLAAASTPGFLAASTALMSDLMMLAFWVWSVDAWVRGVREGRIASLFGSGILAALAFLTKFYAISLVPLLVAYTVAERLAGRRLATAPWIAALSIPLATLALYEWGTHALYDEAHFRFAMSYAGRARAFFGFSPARSGLVGLTFAGGCLASALLFAPLLWSRRVLAGAVAVGALAALLLVHLPGLGLPRGGELSWLVIAQVALFAVGGASVLALALLDWRRHRDPASVLLACWVLGAFVFAAFLNWTNNARANLPMVPPVGILIARRLALRGVRSWTPVALALAASLALALGVARADQLLAGSAREAAQQLAQRYGQGPGQLWFLGHWGFQYYLEREGARAVDLEASALAPHDVVLVPTNNTNVVALPWERFEQVELLELQGQRLLATMSPQVGAGFYSSSWGPLPFAVGAVPSERYFVLEVREAVSFPLGGRLPFKLR